jgi:hypothetical protein
MGACYNLQHKDYDDNLVKEFLEGDSRRTSCTRYGTFRKDTALSVNGRVVAWVRHGVCESVFNRQRDLYLVTKQCTYDVILKHVRATIVAVEKQ